MQEIIHYIKLTFHLLITPQGLFAIFVILGLYALHLFVFHNTPIKALTFVKLIVYPIIFTYGLLMVVLASILEKDTIQWIGWLITFIPIMISLLGYATQCAKSTTSQVAKTH